MEHTEYYHLPQWEADDRIMRTDFNEAMQSIDTALAAQQAAPRIVFGTYTGNGTYGEGHSTALHLDFAPRAVIVLGYATNGGDHSWNSPL